MFNSLKKIMRLKKNLNIFFILFFSIIIISCRPSKTKIIDYENSIINIVNQVVLAEDSLINNLNKDSIYIQSIYKFFNNKVDSSLIAINTFKSIEKETLLRHAAIDVLNVFKNYLEKDYKELIQLVILPDEFYTQDKDKQFNILLKSIDNRLNKELDRLFIEKQKFDSYYFPSKK